ncbi:MAG: ECF transporter S component [Pelosinus sp.]|nr:ECF transporter S component [Pelosinus sp.]
MSRNENITKLTLAAMFAALAFICFSYLRIEIPMGGGMTGKIYIGHAFILLSAFLLGAKYGGLTGAIGLSLADILAGYVVSAPPTFIAKFLLGLAASLMAQQIFHLNSITNKKRLCILSGIAGTVACLVNVITEPVIRYVFKLYIMGYPEPIAYLSAVNCAVSMAVSAIPSIILASFLYGIFRSTILKDSKII